jgi:hypothetical protein
LNQSIFLTVALQARNFVIGTGNTIYEISDTRYGLPWNVTLTDVGGVPVSNAQLQLSLRSLQYGKGFWYVDSDLAEWVRGAPFYVCDDEDTVSLNNSLDVGEDFNASGALEAGTVATIVPLPCEQVGSSQAGDETQSVVTDAAGSIEVCVVYPQEFGSWVSVRLSATAPIDDGTEFTSSRKFALVYSADDLNDTSTSLPGVSSLDPTEPGVGSPFGRTDCNVWDQD